jgi:hypothetical protein
MESKDKIVDFYEYCAKCKFASKTESEDPCYDCMTVPVNTDSHKPINYQPLNKEKQNG